MLKSIPIYLIVFFFFMQPTIAGDKKKLTIGLFDAAPFAFKLNNKIKGITKDLADQLFLKDFDIKYVVYPYSRIIESIRLGTIDLTIMYPNPKILSGSKQIAMTLGNDNILVSLKSAGILNLEDIDGRKIGAIQGANYGVEFEKISLKRLNVLNYKQAMKLLRSQRVDGIIISSAAWKYYLKQMKLNQINYNQVFINFKQNSIFVRKGLSEEHIIKIKSLNSELLKRFPAKKLDSLL
jgi:polar amino acid transport system substrate-binding protein